MVQPLVQGMKRLFPINATRSVLGINEFRAVLQGDGVETEFSEKRFNVVADNVT